MALSERFITMPGQWARAASTIIPNPPIPGVAYRDAELMAEDIERGQSYDAVYDSARYNQLDYCTTGMIGEMERYGILPWSSLTTYPALGMCCGLDGITYQAIQASGPKAPEGPKPTSESAFWRPFGLGWLCATVEPVVLTVSGTYVFEQSRMYTITLVGGGGGGAGGYGSNGFTVGGSGGGSGYLCRIIRWYDRGTEVSYTIGAGGYGGSRNLSGAGSGNGASGGATTFDGISAPGGAGAIGATLASSNTGSAGNGRYKGAHGFYHASATQSVPGDGGDGYRDAPDFGIYGAGGAGGLGSTSLTYLANGSAGNAGAVIIL